MLQNTVQAKKNAPPQPHSKVAQASAEDILAYNMIKLSNPLSSFHKINANAIQPPVSWSFPTSKTRTSSPAPKTLMLKEVGFTHAGFSYSSRVKKMLHHTLQRHDHPSSQHVSKVGKHIDFSTASSHSVELVEASSSAHPYTYDLVRRAKLSVHVFSIYFTYTVLLFPAACSSSLHLHYTSIIIIIIITTPSQNRKPFNPRSPCFCRFVCL